MLSLLLCSFTSVSRFNLSVSVSALVLVFTAGSPRRQADAGSRNAWLLPHGLGFTGPDLLWGVPQSINTSIVFSWRDPSSCFNSSAATITVESPPYFGDDNSRIPRSVSHKSDILILHSPLRLISLAIKWRSEPLPLSPKGSSRDFTNHHNLSVVSPVHGFGTDSCYLVLGHRYSCLGFVDPTGQKNYFSSPSSFIAHYLWGLLVSLINFLKIISGFTEIFTETNLRTKIHPSYSKSSSFSHLPVDSSGPSFLSFASFLRNVFSLILWRCSFISITVLLSCGAVRLGPEDAAEFVSTYFRGADWTPTSHIKVTIFMLFDLIEKASSTQSSTVLTLLSSFFEDLSLLFYVVVVYIFNQRGCIIPSCTCIQTS